MILLLGKMACRGPRWMFQRLGRRQVNAVWRWGGVFGGGIMLHIRYLNKYLLSTYYASVQTLGSKLLGIQQ